MSSLSSRRFVLASRPHGKPSLENFSLEEKPIPALQSEEVLLRTLYVSLDPYMRGRMSDAPSYAPPVEIGAPMTGEAVSEVMESRDPGWKPGDLVLGRTGWQDASVARGEDLTRVRSNLKHPSYALSILGMPGFTAWYGLTQIGKPKPGETIVVSAATGAVGSLVGQIGKILDCNVVGIAGDTEKCRYAMETLGFDDCFDRSSQTLSDDLAGATPHGIDIDFELAGGPIFDMIWPRLNVEARVVICGLISQYSATSVAPGPDRLPKTLMDILNRRIKLDGFIITDHYEEHFDSFFAQMSQWIDDGAVAFREHITDGFENTAQAFLDMLDGRNFGKAVVRIGGA